MGSAIIQRERSLILDCDFGAGLHEVIARDTSDLDCVGGYRIGSKMNLSYGLPKAVEITRKYSSKPIIYEQSGIDTLESGVEFIRALRKAGVDAVIIFPQAGHGDEKAWIEAALERDLGVIIGRPPAHHKCLRSEGGYLMNEAIMKTALNAADSGVRDFAMTGSDPAEIREMRKVLESRGIEPVFYSQDFLEENGSMTDYAKAAGNRWHEVMKFYALPDIRKAVLKYASKL
jgi:orotidine-5'-phosphate decarboxylase